MMLEPQSATPKSRKTLLIISVLIILAGLVFIMITPETGLAPEREGENMEGAVIEGSATSTEATDTPTPTPSVSNDDVKSYRATLVGTFVCLPHKDLSGPQTMECAFGLKADDGYYYGIDFNLSSQDSVPTINTGERISASGLVTPIEMLSSDHMQKYDIKGIFSVTDSFKKL